MKTLIIFCFLCAHSFVSAQKADSLKPSKPDTIKAAVAIKTETLKSSKSETVKEAVVIVEPPAETFKAMKGNFTTELNVNLFQGNLTFNNALQQIKVRYFTANNMAYRFALNFNSKNTKSGAASPYGTYAYNNSDERKSTTIGVGFGVEKHFTGTGKLSPYIGAEISLVNKTSSEKIINNSVETDIDGAWVTSTVQYIPNYGTYTTLIYDEKAFFRYGLNLVAGFDYYFVKNFYFGYEFTFQFYNTKYQNINQTTYGSTNPPPTNSGSETFIGPNLVNGIRLGFIF